MTYKISIGAFLTTIDWAFAVLALEIGDILKLTREKGICRWFLISLFSKNVNQRWVGGQKKTQ